MVLRSIGLLVLLTVLSSSCDETRTKKPTKQGNIIADFDWLIGDWQRTNNQEGKITLESWGMTTDGNYRGIGWTMRGADTLSSEIMVIKKSDNGYVFEVRIPSDSIPTPFEIITAKSSTFTCVNEENEFPKRIVYMKTDKGMEAVISGDGMEIPFFFVPVEQ